MLRTRAQAPLLPCLMLAAALPAMAGYNHPGIFNTQSELEFMKSSAGGSAITPMKRGYDNLRGWGNASLNYQIKPEATVEVVASAVGPSEQNFRNASHAAYAQALQWVVTGDARYKDKGLQILNGWGSTFKGMTNLSNRQQDLEAAWALPTWVAAAEIFRYYDKGAAGWAQADIDKFNNMLNILAAYALYTIEPRKVTNNWGTSSALALMAVGVFQDDTAKFNKGMRHLDVLLPVTVEKTGLLMETCRDCNHAEYNLLGMMAAAEIAWKQGIDFYGRKLDGQTTPRLLMGMEFHAAALLGKPLNVGQACGAQNCSGDDRHASGWEIAYNHYHNRMGLPAPTTTSFVTTQNRPDGLSEDHFTGWTTLTHGELGFPDPNKNPIAIRPYAPARGANNAGEGAAWNWVRNGDRLSLRYKLAGASAIGSAGTDAPQRLEIFSTDGRSLFATRLQGNAGEIVIPAAQAAGLGLGPNLIRLHP
jgi:hypothetical protein